MKKDHRHEIFALAAVVHAAFEDLAAHRKIPKHATDALGLVDAWLKGHAISADDLQAAANLSHEDGVRFEQREKDRPLIWARAAAGNLAWLTKKDRGWQNGGEDTFNAAFYSLSSLNLPGTKDDKAFRVIYNTALKEAVKLPKIAPSKTPKVKTKKADFTKLIGAAAMKRLAKRKPFFDPKERGNETELRELLQQKKYLISSAVIAFDESYGGLIVADAPGEEGYDWLFGAYACLSSSAHKDPRGENAAWVPVAYSPNDVIFFMDENGAVWAIDTIEDVKAARYADSGDAMMKQLLSEK